MYICSRRYVLLLCSADVVEDEKVTVSCVADKIEDLTNEVRTLKQLFTSKEVH